VAFAHSMRLLIVVSVVPVSITLAGFSATEDYRPVEVPFDAAGLAILAGLAAGVGWLIAATSGAYLGTALLSAAPGGIAEMSITAKVLRIGVAFVTAAHVVRYLIVVLFTVPMFRLLEGARARVGR
jgi:uncharacterized membrane protein AbrB (regulator of aidB expression)